MKYSNTRMLIEYIFIALLSYLSLSLAIAIIGGYNYREILCSGGQPIACLFIYWWVPIPRMVDMENENKQK